MKVVKPIIISLLVILSFSLILVTTKPKINIGDARVARGTMPRGESECADKDYVVYKPVIIYQNSKSPSELYRVSEELLTEDHIRGIEFVLKFYKIDFRLSYSGLLIPCSLWNDKDLLANLTKKADDIEWLINQGAPVSK